MSYTGSGTNNGNKKGYNNFDDWNKIESKNPKTQIIDMNNSIVNHMFEDDLEEDEDFLDQDGTEDNGEDQEDLVGDNIGQDYEDDVEEDVEEVEEDDVQEDDVQDVTGDQEDFGEVLELTQFNDRSLVPSNSDSFVVAEYNDIKTVELTNKHRVSAKNFVNKITKFILDFNDVQLSDDHKKYVKAVGNLQLQHLEDLLYLVDVNKQMLNNIIARVNATQAEDYAIITSYNNLANQHLKLMKELQNTYRAIPTVLKKMRSDVLCNQELETGTSEDEVITSEFGETQFNNSKQMLRSILEARNKPEPDKSEPDNQGDVTEK